MIVKSFIRAGLCPTIALEGKTTCLILGSGVCPPDFPEEANGAWEPGEADDARDPEEADEAWDDGGDEDDEECICDMGWEEEKCGSAWVTGVEESERSPPEPVVLCMIGVPSVEGMSGPGTDSGNPSV
jgi:hypothetical protein